MAKVLIGYYSRTGITEKMAEYVAEGVRLTGNIAELKKIAEIKDEKKSFTNNVIHFYQETCADIIYRFLKKQVNSLKPE